MPGPLSLIAALVLSLGAPGAPQAVLAIRGVVKDQTGAVLAGARGELVNEAGAEVGATAADSSGAFRFENPPPGAYSLRITFEGFHPSLPPVRVTGRRAPPPLNVVLDLAAVLQDITVNAADDVIAATAAANRDAVTVDDVALRNLPVFDRDVVGTLSRFLDASAIG